MKEGPDIALLGALIGDPARANMLTALMSGKALTASELAAEGGITLQTASAHLKKLEAAELLRQRKQGRHRYFALAGDEVGNLLETMMGLAAKRGLTRTRTGPKDLAMRKARVCYNHLAGEMGVLMYDCMARRSHLIEHGDDVVLSDRGRTFVRRFGIDLGAIESRRRPLCRSCLDWSARRTHLAGSLGTAMLTQILTLGWAGRDTGSRVIKFSPDGEGRFRELFSA